MKEALKAKHAYLKGRIARNRNLAVLFALAGLLPPIMFPLIGIPLPWFYLSMALWTISSSFLYRYQNLRRGFSGERKVADALKGLDDSYYVLHDVLLDPNLGNIDHILIGPNGVFVIETKNYSGEIVCEGDRWYRVYGERKSPIKSISIQAKRNAVILRNVLKRKGISRWVRPLLVFTNPSAKIRLQEPTVDVVSLQNLLEYITGRPIILNDEEVKRTVKAILEHMKGRNIERTYNEDEEKTAKLRGNS
jgi:hypothetical protein